MVLTCGQHLLVVFHVPTLLLATGTTHDDIVTVGRVCLHLDVVDTEVAFHPEPVDWSRVIVANLLLFCIVAHTHADVVLTAVTPDVVWHFKSDNKDAL